MGQTEIPVQMSAYCCSQFVVSRARIRHLPRLFWQEVWNAFLEIPKGTPDESMVFPASCLAVQEHIANNHHRPSNKAGKSGVWAVVLERLWHFLFGEIPELPLRERDKRLPL